MLTRRILLITGFATASMLLSRNQASAQAGGASAFVQGFGDSLIRVVNSEGGLDEKQQRIRPLIDQDIDVDGIARFCLGRFANNASPQQISEFVHLFHDVLLGNIVSKVGQYRGVTFTMGGSSQRGNGTFVSTVLKQPNNAPNNVQWVVENTGGALKIVDVVAEGTSLRLTQRSDYASFLGQHNGNVNALIEAMKAQIRSS